ncbi:hypothetical protein QT969_21865 [Rhodococcus sp. CSLK01-03]|uniref:Uncharacterized protein n=1 Tax=Rhodococcus indonesiensis TaxID=3055869 RepID=A0ABT7RTG4_9NOCA|nr:hypothetical protein [Rhodococcus indonesiensis]MDM7490935.1 hypothetical protein [Rhodococcus indonesiensis]
MRTGRVVVAATTVAVGAVTGALMGLAANAADGPQPLPELTSPQGMTRFVEDYRTEFGDTLIDDLTLFPEHASFDRAVADDPHRSLSYTFDGEFASWSSPHTRPSDAVAFDLAGLDLVAVSQVILGAPATLRVPDGRVEQVGFDVDDAGRATVAIHARRPGTDQGGHLVLAFDGTPIAVFPFEP